ncbi:hypothetical protein DIS09_31585, partial [Burkholderia pseudomallei]
MDTSAARRNILARIRAAQGRPAELADVEREHAADYVERHPSGPRQPLGDDLVSRFVDEALRLATTVAT